MLNPPPSKPPTAPPKGTGPSDDEDRRVIVDGLAPAMGDALLGVIDGKRGLITLGDDSEAYIGVIPMGGIPKHIAEQALERWHQWVLNYKAGEEVDRSYGA